jgi:RNA polymerase sigma factor (TIGR02999 family)
MRQIVIDAARRQVAHKRGGVARPVVTFDDGAHAVELLPDELLALDEALERLSAVDPRRALVVEHRVFAGLSTHETALALGISTATVERDWRVARAWLAAEVGGGIALA